MRLGGRLRQLRRTRGLTLEAESGICGLSVSHLSEVERGNRLPPRPSHPAWEGIASALGVPAQKLRRAAMCERYPLAERVFDVEGTPWLRRKR